MKRKFKIGIVVDQLLAGGVQLAAIEQVREFNRLGHPAKLLILMRKKYPTDFSYLVEDVPHQFLSDSYPPFARSTIKFPIFSFLSTLHLASPLFAPRVINKRDYDVLISWGTTTCLTTQAIYKKLTIPYIAVIHDPINYILDKVYSNTYLKLIFPLLKSMATYFERSFVKDAMRTVIISSVHKNFLKTNYGVDPKIIRLGVKTLRKIPDRLGGAILSLGRWQKEKGPEFLLSLIKKIPEAHLVIAGSWTDKDDLANFKEKVSRENLESRIEIISYYEERDLDKICKKARLFVHPHFESFGLAALEAASFGLPIIIPKKSGVTEKFKHGVHGYFPKKIEIDEYKKYVVALLKNEELAKRFGKNAQQVVRKEFSWIKNIKSFLDLINFSPDLLKPKMVVIECGHALGAPLAGGDKVMEPMATRLSKKFNFTIIVPKIGSTHWLNAPFPKNLMILPKNAFDSKGSPFQVFLAYVIRMWQSTQILFSLNEDLIIYSSTNVLPDILPGYFAKVHKSFLPWVARIHHLIPPPQKREGNIFVNIVSYLMQFISLGMIKSKADLTIVLNESLKKALLKRGFNNHKIKVLGAGIDLAKIATIAERAKTEAYDGIFVGRLHRTKGIYDLVPIWEKVVSHLPYARLAIIGTGLKEVMEDLENNIKENDLEANINILGYLSDSSLYRTMKKAKVFLFTDHEAGWGIAIAEAMACGLPVVGYNLEIFSDVYKKGFITVPKYNTSIFAKKILHLLMNEKERKVYSKAARFQAKSFGWEKTSEKFSNFLQEFNPGFSQSR